MSSFVPSPPPSPFDADPRPLVAMVRGPVFNASETFVRAQAAGLERYRALIVGLEDKGHVPDALAGRVLLAEGDWERLLVRLGRWGALGERVAAAGLALLHAQFGTDGAMALPLAKRLGVPLVTTLRGFDIGRSRGGLLLSGRLSWMRYALLQRRLARDGDLFFAVSDALRAAAIARGFPAKKLFTLYNGVDLDRFRPGGERDPLTVLHVGRLVEKKGTALLLRAFARVRESVPEAKLVIVGEGPLRPRLERLAGPGVAFLGAQDAETVGEWMRRAALLAAPSLTAPGGDSEGLPNVVVEAAASGLPVVASRHAGIPEAVEDGKTGFLVPEGDAEALARRLAEMLGDGDLRMRMGAAGRALAEGKFDAVRQRRYLEKHYDLLLERTLSKATDTR